MLVEFAEPERAHASRGEIEKLGLTRDNACFPSVAEADGNRTRQRPYRPLTGFEDPLRRPTTCRNLGATVAQRIGGH